MPSLLRRVRRRLRSVRYHAASRPDSGWIRARDWLLLASIPLSIPLVLLLQTTTHRSLVTAEIRGGLAGPRGGPYVAGLAPDAESSIDWPPGAQQATFTLRVHDRLEGWPLTTRVIRGAVTLDLSFFEELSDRRDVELAADSPVGEAIIATLDDPEVALGLPPEIRRVAREWSRTGGIPDAAAAQRYWPGLLGGISIAWLGLSALSVAGVGVSRYFWNVLTQAGEVRRDRSRQAGRCASCGFDLRGNLFAHRCPECGALSD